MCVCVSMCISCVCVCVCMCVCVGEWVTLVHHKVPYYPIVE